MFGKEIRILREHNGVPSQGMVTLICKIKCLLLQYGYCIINQTKNKPDDNFKMLVAF